MKILKIIFILLIGYTICSSINVNNITMGEPYEMQSIVADSNNYFKVEIQGQTYINISIFVSSNIKEDDINVYFHGFISEPLEEDIIDEDQNFIGIELYEKQKIEDGTNSINFFIYLLNVTEEMSYLVIKFIPKTSLDFFGILVYPLDMENLLPKVYKAKFNEILDIDIPKLNKDQNIFFVHSIEEYEGKIIMSLYVPKGSDVNFGFYGFGLETDKFDLQYFFEKMDEFEYLIEVIPDEEKEVDLYDVYKYTFNLNDEKYKYFFLFCQLDGTTEKLQVYFEKDEYEKEEEEEEEEEIDYEQYGIYLVDFLKEYEIKEILLSLGFIIITKNTHSGDAYFYIKVQKYVTMEDFNLTFYTTEIDPFQTEDYKIIEYEFIKTIEEEDKDILVYHFTLNGELYLGIGVQVLKGINYASVYLTNESPDNPEYNDPVIDLKVKTDYKIYRNEFPENIIPQNKKFIFRIENDGSYYKQIQIRTRKGENADFDVLSSAFKHKPSDREIYNSLSSFNKVDSEFIASTVFYDIFIYIIMIPKTKSYFSFLVEPKINLDLLSIYVKNSDDEEEDEGDLNEFEYFKAFDFEEEIIKQKKNNITFPQFILYPKEEENNGEYFLEVVVPENTTEYPVFDIYAQQTNTSNMEDGEVDITVMNLTYKYKMSSQQPNREKYTFSFKLDDGYIFYMISIQLEENIEYLSCLIIPKKIYNIIYSTEYQIEKKYLITSPTPYNTFISTEPHIGDNYIKLKVKKGLTNVSFNLEGCEDSKYSENCEINIDIKFDKIYPRDEYDILQYYFKTNQSSSYFYINLMINKDVDFLTIKFDKEIEYDNPEDISYEFEYFKNYDMNITSFHNLYPKYILKPKEKMNSGEYLLNIKTSHSDKPEFVINAFEIENFTSMEESIEINLTLNDLEHDTENKKDTYKYSFTLDKDFNYYMIFIKPKVEYEYFSYIFELPKIEYNNITYSDEIKIDKKNLIESSSYSLSSTAENNKDNYIKLKVQKGVGKDSFYLEGYTIKGKLRYLAGDEVPLDINYDDKYPGDEYDIHQYSFKLGKNTKDFKINVKLLKSLEYLSIKLDTESEPKKSKDSGVSVGVIVLIVILVVLFAALLGYFIIRKMGCLKKSDVTSKDIETVGQISTQL